jgi:hypothetical protein
MTTLERDSRFLSAALPDLESYLLSETLYWPLGGSLPRLTPGTLLLSLRRLEALDPFTARKWQARFDSVRAKRRTAWEQKTLQEIRNRLRLWSASISEWQSDEDERRADYAGAISGRVILQLLLQETSAPEEQTALEGLDHFLRAKLKPAPFLWEPRLEQAFSRDEFWFLYGKLI